MSAESTGKSGYSCCMPKNCCPIYVEHSIFSTACCNSEVTVWKIGACVVFLC